MSKKWLLPDCEGLRVLQIVPELDIGGAEMTTLEVARALSAAGGEAFVMSEGGRLVSPLLAAGAQFIQEPVARKNPITLIQNARKIRDFINRAGISLVHARSRAPAWSALWASRACHIPFVTTYHSKVHEAPRVKVLYNSVMARGDRVIANSQFTADQIKKVHQVGDDRLRIIPRGCDLEALDPKHFSAAKRRAMRSDLSITPADFVVLCPARLTSWKGQKILLEALAQTQIPRDQLILLFAGDAQGRDAYVQELKDLADKHGVRAQFLGLVRDMPACYAVSDIVVIPSIEAEPFGRTAIEAQAAGRAVIASDAGGFKETVMAAGPARTGWLTPPSDVVSLAQCLNEAFLLSPAQRQSLGRAARRHVCANFSTDRLCAETLAVYRELVPYAPIVRAPTARAKASRSKKAKA